MKMIIAIIKPTRLEQVRTALTEIGVVGLTCSEVTGYGRQKGHTEIYRGSEYTVDFLPKLKLELVIGEDRVEDAVKAIQGAAQTGKIGDGKIFISTVEQSVRIRTGDTGEASL